MVVNSSRPRTRINWGVHERGPLLLPLFCVFFLCWRRWTPSWVAFVLWSPPGVIPGPPATPAPPAAALTTTTTSTVTGAAAAGARARHHQRRHGWSDGQTRWRWRNCSSILHRRATTTMMSVETDIDIAAPPATPHPHRDGCSAGQKRCSSPAHAAAATAASEGTAESAVRRGRPQRYRRSPSPTPFEVKADLDAFFSNWVYGDDSSDN